MTQVETIRGNLRAVAQLVEGTLQHWDELSRDQTADLSLGERAYWVADYPQYGKKGSELMLYLARLAHNLVFQHLFDEQNSSWEQLLNTRTGHFFHPAMEEAQAVIEAADTLPIPLRALRLQGDNSHYRFLQVRTEDGFVNTSRDPRQPHYEQPIAEEQQLLERAGYIQPFLNTLRNSPWRITDTDLYLLNLDFALQAATEGPVGRAAWRSYFDDDASSNADDHLVNFRSALRGVPLVAPQGRAAESRVPEVPSEIKAPTMEEILQVSRPHVSDFGWGQFQAEIGKLYKQ